MFGNPIARRVKKAIAKRIQIAEREYATICSTIDKDSAQRVKEIYLKQEQDKMDAADRLVDSILG